MDEDDDVQNYTDVSAPDGQSGADGTNPPGAVGALPRPGTPNADLRQGALAAIVGPGGSLERAREARRLAYERAIEAAGPRAGGAFERMMPYLAFAGAMMTPNRSGTVGEALSAASQTAGPLFNQQSRDRRASDSLIAQLTTRQATDEERGEIQRANIIDRLTREGTARRSAFYNTVRDMGIDPDSPQGQAMIRQLAIRSSNRAPTVVVNNSLGQGFGTTLGRGVGEDFITTSRGQIAAANTLAQLDEVDRLLQQGGPTGTLTPILDWARSAAQSFGIEFNTPEFGRLGEREQLAMLLDRMTMEANGGRLGAGVSNADLAFTRGLVPRITNTQEGNLLITNAMRSLLRRTIQQSEVLQRLRAEAGSDPTRIAEIPRRYAEEVRQLPPLFDEAFRARANEISTTRRPGTTVIGRGGQDGQRGQPQVPTWSGPLPQGVPETARYLGVRTLNGRPVHIWEEGNRRWRANAQ